jgi:hypothetical protein
MAPFHVHLIAPSNEGSTYIKPLWAVYSMGSIRRRYDFGVSHSWIQNLAYWPLNLMMRELAEKKIAGGDRAWRKHRTLDVPLGL